MNTIPSIFNEHQINRTVLGGSQIIENSTMNISVILLNQGGSHYRVQMLETLLKCGFEEIFSVESDPDNYNLEDFSHQFPQVKFIVPLEKVTTGDMINLGAAESTCDWFLVLNNSLTITKNIITKRTFEVMTEKSPYCICPRLAFENENATLVRRPIIDRKSRLQVLEESAITDLKPTLFPQNFIALYNRKKFVELGGFDYTIKSPYWQNLDLGFRAWLWGEKILLSTIFNASYSFMPEENDVTASLFSSRFFLKNLAPHFDNDHAYLSRSQFIPFWRRSSCGYFEALRQFSGARNWVLKNQYRFKFDAAELVEKWGQI